MLKIIHSQDHQARFAESAARFAEVKAHRVQYLNKEEGKTLSLDDIQDIYF